LLLWAQQENRKKNMTTQSDIKAQPVRIMDVFVLGPAMVLSTGYISDPVLRAVMMVGGIGTIAYNASNYFAIKRRSR
jgi:hypothetical protein